MKVFFLNRTALLKLLAVVILINFGNGCVSREKTTSKLNIIATKEDESFIDEEAKVSEQEVILIRKYKNTNSHQAILVFKETMNYLAQIFSHDIDPYTGDKVETGENCSEILKKIEDSKRANLEMGYSIELPVVTKSIIRDCRNKHREKARLYWLYSTKLNRLCEIKHYYLETPKVEIKPTELCDTLKLEAQIILNEVAVL